MAEQKIPGVKDAKRPGIAARTYAVWTAGALAIFAVVILAVSHFAGPDPVDTVTFDLATPGGASCSYDADTQQTTIRTHLDSTTRHDSEVVLTAGVRDPETGLPAARTERTVTVRGHHEADYTFVVDAPTATRGTDCFVETATTF